MSALLTQPPAEAARHLLADRPRAARRRRAEDGAITQIARELLRDARTADARAARPRTLAAPRPVRRVLSRERRRPAAALCARPRAVPLA